MRAGTTPGKRLLLAVLLVAALIRLVHFFELRDSAVFHFEEWAETDMRFYRDWSADIREGNLLGDPAPRPLHWNHSEIAREAHSLAGDPRPFNDDLARDVWTLWLGERTFHMDPLHAYLLAAVEAALGTSVLAALILQGLMGLGIVAIVFGLACTLFDRWAGFAAGLIAAFYAPLVFFEGHLLRPVIVSLLVLAAALVATRAMRQPHIRTLWLLAGALAGMSVLAFSGNILIAASFLLLPFLAERRAIVPTALVLAGFVLAVSPLAVRNLAVGLPPWSGAGTGTVNFVWHNLPGEEDYGNRLRIEATGRILYDTGGRFGPAARKTIEANGGTAGWLASVAGRSPRFWRGRELTNNIAFAYALSFGRLLRWAGVRYFIIVPLAFAGLVFARREWRASLPTLLIVSATWLLCAVFATHARVRLPAALALIPFAAHGLVRGVVLATRRDARRLAPAILAATAGTALSLLPWNTSFLAIRDADYGVGNLIAVNLSRRQEIAGDPDRATRIVASHLATEPEGLRELWADEGESRLGARDASLAVHFVALHKRAAELARNSGDTEADRRHELQAARLAEVARLAGARERSDAER